MNRFLKWVLRVLLVSAVLLLYGALIVGGYKLLKCGDRAVGLGVWPAEPSLDSIDPMERAEAAKLAAKKYGGDK